MGTKMVSVRLDATEVAELDELARSLSMSRTGVIRHLLTTALRNERLRLDKDRLHKRGNVF